MSFISPIARTHVRAASDRRRAPRRGHTLLWATIAAIVTGLLGFGSPLDDYYRMARNMLRSHAPSGQVVAVEIDDHSLDTVGAWPWGRDKHAALIDALKRAGVRRVFYDVIFNTPGEPAQDRRFAEAMRSAGNVYLPAVRYEDKRTGEYIPKLPLPELRAAARGVVNISTRYNGMIAVQRLPYQREVGNEWFHTMSPVIAGKPGGRDVEFPVDYAIDFARVPHVSVADVFDNPETARKLKGKDVVILAAARELGDLYYVPGRGQLNGGYIQILAAETLMAGYPHDLGWWPLLLAAFSLASVIMFVPGVWMPRLFAGLAILLVTVLPFVAEQNHYFLDVAPALLLAGTAVATRMWNDFSRSYKVLGNINAVSGLPNLNALRDESVPDEAVLVAARVRNFPQIRAALPPEGERALVEQIVARLALGARGARIFQGDEGIFVWPSAGEAAGPDQIDALHALFRSPALVDGRQIDLSVTFGLDNGGGRDLANRIGATLVAADEASAEGLRWKAYDPSKLADADWQLSLLGRLDAAIDTGEVWVAYQPQLDLATGRISGAEALVRWSHPEKGQISPLEFVLAAEQHDRIDKLTEFVLSDSIKAAAAFAARGIAFDVAVNISARLLERPGLVDTVRRLLDQSNLPYDRLTLEVTESAAMTSGRASIKTLEELGSLGINVSIDDYGTGFSTLDYFKKIPATEVKVDRSFVAAIDSNASDRVMVRSTIELAHSLGRIVVAEGVETRSVLDELVTLGCDKAQGYFIGRPMKLIQISKLMMEQAKSRAA